MSNIDLGDNPQGQVPDAAQKSQMRNILEVLPLAGGTMNAGAQIAFDNGSAIREGQVYGSDPVGLELECQVGYRWQWSAGRILMRDLNSNSILRVIAMDDSIPNTARNATEGYLAGSRWETTDGKVYECIESDADAAVWNIKYTDAAKVKSITGNPNTDQFANYEATVGLVVNNIPMVGSMAQTLNYAGQYNGQNCYTIGGVPIVSDPLNEPNYTAIFYDGDTFRYRFYISFLNLNRAYVCYPHGENIVAAFGDPMSWTEIDQLSADIQQITLPQTTGLRAEVSGQIVQNFTNKNYYVSSVNEGNIANPQGSTTWSELVGVSGVLGTPLSGSLGNCTNYPASQINGTLPISKGGTGATTQQTASAALNPPIIDNAGTSITLTNATHNGAVLRCTTPTSNVTITVNADLGTGFSCDIIRAGTGTVTIQGTVGQTVQAFTGNRISGQYGRATLTRVAANTYNLSGNTHA